MILAEVLQSITPDTGLHVTISVAATAVLGTCIFVVRTTWRVANVMRDVKDITNKLRETWSFEYMKDWAHDLERHNSAIKPNADGVFSLSVPDPRTTRTRAEGRSVSGTTNPY